MRTPAVSVSWTSSYSPPEAGNIGGSTTHVKADDSLSAPLIPRCHCVSHHSARWSGQDGVAAFEVIGSDQPAVRLHEQQRSISQPVTETRTETIQILADMRGQVGIHAGGCLHGLPF